MNDFPKPLNEWLDEEVDVPSFSPIVDKKGNVTGVEQKTVKRTVRTIYTQSMPSKFSCKPGEHSYFMSDKHRHIASCKNCTKNLFVRPVFEYLKDGHVLHRDTHEIID